VNEVLEATLAYFPDSIDSHYFHREIATTIETFFLLDHCIEEVDAVIEPPTTPLRRFRSVSKLFRTNNNSNSNNKDEQQQQQSPKEAVPPIPSLHSVPEPLQTVQNAVGGAIDNVGNFIKDRLGEPTKRSVSLDVHSIGSTPRSAVVPYTRKSRRSFALRHIHDLELNDLGEDAKLLLDDERPPTELVPSYSHPLPTFGSPGSKFGDLLETNPFLFLVIFIAAAKFLDFAVRFSVTMDLDILLLFIWTSFCIGLHTPRPMVGGIDKSATPSSMTLGMQPNSRHRRYDRNGRELLRMSMLASTVMSTTPNSTTFPTVAEGERLDVGRIVEAAIANVDVEDSDDDEDVEGGQSPLPRFPQGAPLGSKLNCWSEPDYETFQVRGCNYLSDRVKEASGPFVFPIRAVDLFLTDTCPENAGRNSRILGGRLREKPTFIINFRLPWGIFLAYFEIPERFIPFIRAGHEAGFDKSTLQSLNTMSPVDRCVARFCQDPESVKNKKLKIVPVVVEGPWVVRSVVGGKPAIIGNKMPVRYHYFAGSPDGKEAMYLEADLDVVSSSAARGILSVARTYTQVLTIDLGFVVQGNTSDELPEQMLVGARLHGIDPMTAPPYPLSAAVFSPQISDSEESTSEGL